MNHPKPLYPHVKAKNMFNVSETGQLPTEDGSDDNKQYRRKVSGRHYVQ